MSTRSIALIVIFFSFMMFAVVHTLSEGIDQINTNVNRSFDDLGEYE